MGGFFVAVGAFQVWSGSTSGDPFSIFGILIFVVGWVLGWAGLYELTNLVIRHRTEKMDALEPDQPIDE